MDYLQFFDLKRKFNRIILNPNETVASMNKFNESPKAEGIESKNGTEYAKLHVEESNRKALQTVLSMNCKNDETNIDEISLGSAVSRIENEDVMKVYNSFNFEHRPNNLKINDYMDEIVNTIDTHSITIIEGFTGCGKTTQVPQFILNSSYRQGKYCNIIVTQPRRIAALSITERVSKERGWPVGTLVGVHIGMYRNVSNDTRLTYCTTGILLRRLIQTKNMLDFTHIVLDEVHERDQEMDFLLLVIRELLRINSRQVKIILMSATFNIVKFSKYFSIPTERGFIPAPVITVKNKRNYKVHVHYLCQLRSLGVLPEIILSEPKVTEKMISFCLKLINVFDDIDDKSEYDFEDIKNLDNQSPRFAVLVFLPGLWEIEKMYNMMVSSDDSSKWDIVIMHSSITHDEQAKIFTAPAKGCRRIILSTNITESSITIDVVKYVIDFCLAKQLVSNSSNHYECLELTWASKSNCEQRAGRAGRVMDGRVYRFIPKDMYELLPVEPRPEILCSPLENLILQAKLLDMGEPEAILALAIEPPDLSNIKRTILFLKEAGGLVDKFGYNNDCDGELTNLGRIMAVLPINIRYSKLIALGQVFNVLRETIVIAAAMSIKSLFSNPFNNRLEAFSAKVHWTDNSTSDCMGYLNAYTVWRKEILSNRLKKKSYAERCWAKRNFIEIKLMHEVDYLVCELTNRLEALGVKETVGPQKVLFNEVGRNFVLKIVIAGAFYPNYFVRNRAADDLDTGDLEINRTLGGLDPSRTVYLRGWSQRLNGRLYSKRIQEIFKGAVPSYDQTIIKFDNSKKVYVTFSEDKQCDEEPYRKSSHNVSMSVYMALKMRHLDLDISIPVLGNTTSNRVNEKIDVDSTVSNCRVFFNQENYTAIRKALPSTLPDLPDMDQSVIPVVITRFVNPSKFWVRIDNADNSKKLKAMDSLLNEDGSGVRFDPVTSLPSIVGTLVAVEWKDKRLCRAVVESCYKIKAEDVANVLLIDYGHRCSKRAADLRMIDGAHGVLDSRGLAFECRLSAIEPARVQATGQEDSWSEEACELFTRYTSASGASLLGLVYSVVDSVVALELVRQPDEEPSSRRPVTLNDLMISKGFAVASEENYSSRYNNDLRGKSVAFDDSYKNYLKYLQYDQKYLINAYPEPPDSNDCRSTVALKGPFSPLEITLSGLAADSTSMKILTNTASVNSVLLDSNPGKPHECFLVASVVKQSPSGIYLNINETTLMPSIDGLLASICLIFAPRVELRKGSAGSHYVGALCGLGYNEQTNQALLPEHDMEIYFDVEFNTDDILDINRLRYWMNMAICVRSNDIDNLNEQTLKCQRKIYNLLQKLIDRPTRLQKPKRIRNFRKWNLYDESLILYPRKEVVKADSIYPLHCALKLRKRNEIMENMLEHILDLRSSACSDLKLQDNIEFLCQLCKETIYGRENLRKHLFMPYHREREENLTINKANILL